MVRVCPGRKPSDSGESFNGAPFTALSVKIVDTGPTLGYAAVGGHIICKIYYVKIVERTYVGQDV